MQPYQMDSKMKDIELGMTKKKVISILGKDFESAGARMTSEGSIETISYKTASKLYEMARIETTPQTVECLDDLLFHHIPYVSDYI